MAGNFLKFKFTQSVKNKNFIFENTLGDIANNADEIRRIDQEITSLKKLYDKLKTQKQAISGGDFPTRLTNYITELYGLLRPKLDTPIKPTLITDSIMGMYHAYFYEGAYSVHIEIDVPTSYKTGPDYNSLTASYLLRYNFDKSKFEKNPIPLNLTSKQAASLILKKFAEFKKQYPKWS